MNAGDDEVSAEQSTPRHAPLRFAESRGADEASAPTRALESRRALGLVSGVER